MKDDSTKKFQKHMHQTIAIDILHAKMELNKKNYATISKVQNINHSLFIAFLLLHFAYQLLSISVYMTISSWYS